MSIKRIDIISIPVSDQARSKALYVDKLGLAVKRDNPMGPDQRWVELATAAGETSITLVHWFDKMPPGCVQGTVLGTDDIAKTHAELTARGVEIGQSACASVHPRIMADYGRTWGTIDRKAPSTRASRAGRR